VFHLSQGVEPDWFDPALNVDTPLFVDPFLLYWAVDPEFNGAFDGVFDHFRRLFEQLAADPNAQVERWLRFPEVPEVCLGYSRRGVMGLGTGTHGSGQIRRAMASAIQAGLGAVGDHGRIPRPDH
jgi:hypothetical protein